MNPNSRNQRWSKWVVTATLPRRATHEGPAFFAAMQHDAGTLMRDTFGSAGQARVTVFRDTTHERWIVETVVEGADVHDPGYRARTCLALETHYRTGFGPLATVVAEAGMLAGSAEDGTPADQWLVMPTIGSVLTAQEV